MLKSQRQDFQAVCLLLSHDFADCDPQVQLAKLGLVRHFPNAHDTDENRVSRVEKETERCWGRPSRLAIPPDESVRVQQGPHESPAQNSSGSGASKSSLIFKAPGCKPG